jgi:type I restriction enzyme S subunit
VIALLNEQKQAIIHRAVTRGLDPSVPLKDSGVPWLGEIPKHWEVRRAKYLFREVDDRSKEGKETHLAMSQRLGLVPSTLVDGAMRSESYAGAKLCQEGDLVLNRLKAHLGVFALAEQGGVISPDYSVFRKRAAISMKYYESVLKSSACRRELRIRAKGLVEGFWRLYTDDFYDIRIPVPPLNEQHEIMSAMSVQTVGLNTAITRLEREITLLREYRTRLVADVVTGKLDVRAVAASLPDEAPLDDATASPDPDDALDPDDLTDTEGDA